MCCAQGDDMTISRHDRGPLADNQRVIWRVASDDEGLAQPLIVAPKSGFGSDLGTVAGPAKVASVVVEAAPTVDTVPGSTATSAVLVVGTSTEVVIDTLGDHDWYQIGLVAGQTYVFTTQAIPSSNPDTFLTLRNASGVAITSDDDGGDSTYSLLTYTATTSGLFYLDVGTYSDASTGSMRVAAVVVPPAGPDSVDSTTATIATLAVGGAVAGNIESAGDHDWFRITLTAGQSYLFRTGGTTPDDNGDTTLTLRDASGTVLGSNDDAGEGAFSGLRFTATTSGTYFVDVGAFGSSTGEYTLTASPVAPLSVYSNDEIGYQLTNGYWGGGSHHFDVAPGGTLTVNLTALTAAGQTLAREAFAVWGDVTGITFSEVSTAAQITLDDNQTGAFANASFSNGIISSATVNIGTAWLSTYGTSLNSYSFQTYIHEIGHAMGLGHAGNYNGSADWATDAFYANDSWATTIMSYFDQTENGYFAGLGFTRQFLLTPMVADGVAMTTLYGAHTQTRTGNTTYGFANTSGRAIYDAVANPSVSYTVYDGGGTDALNYSGFWQNQRISLVAESFSNVGGRVGNVAIARGVVIENAYGGVGNDTLIGNAADNWLAGNGGNDAIDGGDGSDTALFLGVRADYTITYVSATRVVVSSAAEGIDTIDNVEFLAFSDTIVSTTANSAPDDAAFSVAPVTEGAANGTVFGLVTGSDPDAGDALFYSLADDAGGRFAINAFSGLLSVADGALIDFEAAASHTITVRITDQLGAFADFDYAVTVANANDQAPVFDPVYSTHGPFLVAEGSTTVVPLFATDPDQLVQYVTYSVTGGADAALFTIDAATATLRFIAAPDFEAPLDAGGDNFYDVEVTAFDGVLGTAQAFTVIVTDADEVPASTYKGTNGIDIFTVADASSWTISGLAGNDTLTGGSLGDIILGGRGNDILAGGGGNDIFKVGAGEGIDSYDGGDGYDSIRATRDTMVISIGALAGIELISGDVYSDVSIGGTSAADVLDFSGVELYGIVRIDAGNGADTIIGSSEADTIALGLGNDVLRGGGGMDTFLAKASTGVDIIDGGDDIDMIVATAANFALNVTGLISIEAIDAAGFENVRLVGGNGADVIDFSSTVLVGIANIAGLGGNDTIIGSLLADRIIGGLGRDVLTGGDDADTFVFESTSHSGVGATRADHITDFVSGIDLIDLTAIDADTGVAGNQEFVFIGGDAFTGRGQLRLGTDSEGNVALFGNTGGSLSPDFQISFDNNAPLVATDLLL